MARLRSLTGTWRALYVLIGVALLGYAIYGHEVIAGLMLLVLIVLGVLSLVKGLLGR